MKSPRVFVTYHFVDVTHRDYQFAIRLINDLRLIGFDVVTEETTILNGNFVQYLNEVLPTCQWLILVQTPDALHSRKVQMTVNIALTLVVQQRMLGVLPVITVPCEPREVPAAWAILKTCDATEDYQRALARVLLTLDLKPVPSEKQFVVAPPPSRVSTSSPIVRPAGYTRKPDLPGTRDSSSKVDRPEGLTPLVTTFERTNSIPESHPDRENHPDMPVPLSSSTRQHRNRWLTALSVALALVLFITSVVLATRTFSKSSPNPTATVDANLTAIARDVNATALANATATAIASTDPYPPFSGKLVLYDPLSNNSRGYGWEEILLNPHGGTCQFIGNAYIAAAPQKSYRPCHSTTIQPSNFTFEVRMQIITGNCGGISLRDTTAIVHAYHFMVCQDGTYAFERFDGSTVVKTLKSGSSTPTKTGLKQSNLVAIVANGSNFDLYMNNQKIDSVSDSTYSQGQFGISADGSTTAAYMNARLWTL